MAATELAPGARYGADGRYTVQRLLSTGGMASVWLGRDVRLHRLVAMKFLADSLALDRDYLVRFAREARVAAQLSHPNLVGVYDYDEQGPRPFLVMEYVPAGTLADRLREGGAAELDPERVARELLSAVAHIHEAGVVHRDIKPGNVLIGSDGRCRLTDFGIAQPPAATQLTDAGMVLGTARYLAPEVLRGARADARSDLYACGVLLGQLLDDHPHPALARVAGQLAQSDPGARPASARAALELLERGETATRPMARTAATRARAAQTAATVRRPAVRSPWTRPEIVRDGRHIRVRVSPATALALTGAIAVAVIALVLALSAGGSAPSSTPHSAPALPARSAPLPQQLTYLDRVIDQAQR